MAKAEGEVSEKLGVAVRYALGYKHAYLKLHDMAQDAHKDAIGLASAITDIKKGLPQLNDDIATTMRMLGGVCQLVKVTITFLIKPFFSYHVLQQMREVEYAKPLDADFKQFLEQKKRGQSSTESVKERTGALLSDDLVDDAKRFGYIFSNIQ